jgi:hypothetical protein
MAFEQSNIIPIPSDTSDKTFWDKDNISYQSIWIIKVTNVSQTHEDNGDIIAQKLVQTNKYEAKYKYFDPVVCAEFGAELMNLNEFEAMHKDQSENILDADDNKKDGTPIRYHSTSTDDNDKCESTMDMFLDTIWNIENKTDNITEIPTPKNQSIIPAHVQESHSDLESINMTTTLKNATYGYLNVSMHNKSSENRNPNSVLRNANEHVNVTSITQIADSKFNSSFTTVSPNGSLVNDTITQIISHSSMDDYFNTKPTHSTLGHSQNPNFDYSITP